MRHIAKGTAPRPLVRYRLENPGAGWHDGVPRDVGVAVRRNLWRAQLGLCCYCGARIANPEEPGLADSHVEHFRSHADHEEGRLDWANLFLSCNAPRHCGPFKGDAAVVRLDPSDHPERWLALLRSGDLEGTDEVAEHDLGTLGLNDPSLRQRRSGAIRGLQRALGERRSGSWSAEMLQRTLDRAIRERLPFLPAIELWLRAEIARR